MLFRQKALDHSTKTLSGDVLVQPPVSFIFITVGLTLWVLLLFIWLSENNYTQKRLVSGWLVPLNGVTKVYNPIPGSVIERIYFQEHDEVNQGDVLLRLKKPNMSTGNIRSDISILEELAGQKKSVKGRIRRVSEDSAQQAINIDRQVVLGEKQLVDIRALIEILRERELIAKQEAEKFAELFDRNAISAVENNSILKELLAIQGVKIEQDREYGAQQAEIEMLRNQRVQIKLESATQISELEERLSDLNQRTIEVQSNNQSTVLSPIAGVISNMQINLGQTVPGPLPLLEIVPKEYKLQAKLLVPIEAIGHLALGKKIFLRYDSFPYQKYGVYEASITNISQTVSSPEEILDRPIALKEFVYLVTATLHRPAINSGTTETFLRPDMTFKAEIFLRKQSLLAWLLEPFSQSKNISRI